MQSGIGLRTGKHVNRLVQQPGFLASRTPQWQSRRSAGYFNPISWIQEKFSPQPKERNVEKTAQEQQAKMGEQNVFAAATREVAKPQERKKWDMHKYSTGNFKISHRKLNMLGRQIAGKPIDYAILQMQFSEKRASTRIKSVLATAKAHATNIKNMDASKLIVSEAWVTKGPKQLKRLQPKGRGKFQIIVHPDSRMHVVLREGKAYEEKMREQRERRLKRIVSAGLVREDVPLRNPSTSWQW